MQRLAIGLVLGTMLALAGCGGGSGPRSPGVPPGAREAVIARSNALDAATLTNSAAAVLAFYSLNYTDDLGNTRTTIVQQVKDYFAAWTVISISNKQSTFAVVGDHVVEQVNLTLVDQQKTATLPTTWTIAEEDRWYLENGTWVIRWSQAPVIVRVAHTTSTRRRLGL